MNAAKTGTVLFFCAVMGGCAGQEPATQEPTPAATEATQPEVAAAPAPAAEAAPAVAETPTAPGPMDKIIVKDGISTPESVLYDADADQYLVSNINGTPLEVDDNGFISKIAPDGKVVELKWIDGAKENIKLNAPKGMAIVGGVLYVSDIDSVRKFDAKTGEPKGEIAIKGATFLNDIAAAADGTIYVTDSGLKPDFSSSGTDAVYKIVKDKAKALIKNKDLKGPNGLLVDDSGVWVVGFGGSELYNVKSGKKADVKTLPNGGLDGIAKTNDGKLLVTSWQAKQVFASGAAGDTSAWTPIASDIEGPADIGYDSKRNRVLIPVFMGNAVQIQPL